MTPIETLAPFLRDAYVSTVELSAYRYVPRDMSDARRYFTVATARLTADYDVIAAGLESDEEIAFHSKVTTQSGATLHVPMIDFLGALEDEHLHELEKLLAEWSIPRLAIFSSGRSFHGYGLALIDPKQWVRFMGRLLLLNAPEQPQWIDTRWIGHKLMAGSGALRWSWNTRIYDGEPRLVKMVHPAERGTRGEG